MHSVVDLKSFQRKRLRTVIIYLAWQNHLVILEIGNGSEIELQTVHNRGAVLLLDLPHHEVDEPALVHIVLLNAVPLKNIQRLLVASQRLFQQLVLLSVQHLEHLHGQVLRVVLKCSRDVGVNVVGKVAELNPQVGVGLVELQTPSEAGLDGTGVL